LRFHSRIDDLKITEEVNNAPIPICGNINASGLFDPCDKIHKGAISYESGAPQGSVDNEPVVVDRNCEQLGRDGGSRHASVMNTARCQSGAHKNPFRGD